MFVPSAALLALACTLLPTLRYEYAALTARGVYNHTRRWLPGLDLAAYARVRTAREVHIEVAIGAHPCLSRLI